MSSKTSSWSLQDRMNPQMMKLSRAELEILTWVNMSPRNQTSLRRDQL